MILNEVIYEKKNYNTVYIRNELRLYRMTHESQPFRKVYYATLCLFALFTISNLFYIREYIYKKI